MEAIVRAHPKLWMLVIYMFLVSAFLYVRPSVAFDQDGVRPFGTGNRKATIFPVWWWMFVMAVTSYVSVVYYLGYL